MSSMMGPITGILINNDHIDIISNNIANASTIGYKSSKPVFFDIFSRSFYANTTSGQGVGISGTIQNFNNGILVETGRDLDLGIMQDGFFRVLDAKGNVHYTRDGQFLLDKNKNIVNMQGMYLTGKNQSHSKNTNDTSDVSPINLKYAYILKEKPTSEITLKAILNKNTIKNSDNINENLLDPESYTTHINIYNKEGEEEQINISFTKKDQNTWTVNVTSNESAKNEEKNINNNFEIKFNSSGELISDASFNINAKNNSKYEQINLNLSGTIEQSALDNSLEEYFQDGYSTGALKTFNIFPNGEIIGTYSNQQTQLIGQILLSKFINPEKLKPESGNLWEATEESGKENIGIAGDAGFGILSSKTLETSNVDLNKELINMIIAQRNYQSNAQSFKTEDKIISTLIDLR